MRYLLALALPALLLTGCVESSSTPSPEPTGVTTATVNAFCPIMGGKVSEKGGQTQWDGKTIGFCFPDCEPKWEALSDTEKAEKLAAAGDPTDMPTHDHGNTHEHGGMHEPS